jgi:CO/xanthine dehydrogenase Mo-binding subunit
VTLRRVTGDAAFAGDVAPAGLLHLALRRSPHARARVRAADPAPALALPGVVTVLTPRDVPRLLRSEPAYVGDRVAAAAAEDAELARRAVAAVRIDFEPLAATLDARAAASDPACVAARLSTGSGDAEQELRRSEVVVERVWHVPFTPAIALETPVATTWLDEDRRLVVRTSAESPFLVRGILAERLSLPAARIRVVRPLVAGGCAGRTDLVAEDVCAAVTLRTGRPARLALSAGEELTTTPGRPAQRVRVRVGLSGGAIAAISLELLVDLGASDEGALELLRSSARHALALYRAASLHVEAIAVRTNRPPASAPRGADAAAAFALECAIDAAAEAAGEDPAEFRRRHLRRVADPGTPLLAELGERVEASGSTAAATLLPRTGAADRVETADSLREATGMAVARRSTSGEAAPGAAAALRLLDDGSFHLAASHASSGGSDEAACLEAAAAILAVAPERIVCAAADTDSAAFETAVPTPLGAELAVAEAAREVRTRILEAGAALLGAESSGLRVERGCVREPAGRSVTFAEIGAAALRDGHPIAATAAPTPAGAAPCFAAAEARVAVDVETGIVLVRRLSATLRGGPFPDPRLPAARVEGALAMALEQALAGGLGFDDEGRPAVRSFRDWPLVAAADVPPLAVSFVPADDASPAPDAAALGDVAGRAALSAIAIAVARATGTRPGSLPLTPAAVLEAAAHGTDDEEA